MAGKAEIKEFRERVYIKIRSTGDHSHSDKLIGEMIDALLMKKALGVHHSWIKQAMLEKFMREKGLMTNGESVSPVAGGVPGGEVAIQTNKVHAASNLPSSPKAVPVGKTVEPSAVPEAKPEPEQGPDNVPRGVGVEETSSKPTYIQDEVTSSNSDQEPPEKVMPKGLRGLSKVLG